jgi:hypothetical protein
MSTSILIIIIAIILVLIYIKAKNKDGVLDVKINAPIKNDKIIVIENGDYLTIKKAVLSFYGTYNKSLFKSKARLINYSGNVNVITFPFDIQFSHLCLLHNYLHYWNEHSVDTSILTWASYQTANEWLQADLINKKMLLHIPSQTLVQDHVYLTTEDQQVYRIDFANEKENIKLEVPLISYFNHNLDLKTLESIAFEDLG